MDKHIYGSIILLLVILTVLLILLVHNNYIKIPAIIFIFIISLVLTCWQCNNNKSGAKIGGFDEKLLNLSKDEFDNRIKELTNMNIKILEYMNAYDYILPESSKIEEYIKYKFESKNPIYNNKYINYLSYNINNNFSKDPNVKNAIKRNPKMAWNSKFYNIDNIEKFKENKYVGNYLFLNESLFKNREDLKKYFENDFRDLKLNESSFIDNILAFLNKTKYNENELYKSLIEAKLGPKDIKQKLYERNIISKKVSLKQIQNYIKNIYDFHKSQIKDKDGNPPTIGFSKETLINDLNEKIKKNQRIRDKSFNSSRMETSYKPIEIIPKISTNFDSPKISPREPQAQISPVNQAQIKTTSQPTQAQAKISPRESQPSQAQAKTTSQSSQPQAKTTSQPTQAQAKTTSQPTQAQAKTTSQPTQAQAKTTSQPTQAQAKTTSQPTQAQAKTTSQPTQAQAKTTSQSSQPQAKTTSQPQAKTTSQPQAKTTSQPQAKTTSQPQAKTTSQPQAKSQVKTTGQQPVKRARGEIFSYEMSNNIFNELQKSFNENELQLVNSLLVSAFDIELGLDSIVKTNNNNNYKFLRLYHNNEKLIETMKNFKNCSKTIEYFKEYINSLKNDIEIYKKYKSELDRIKFEIQDKNRLIDDLEDKIDNLNKENETLTASKISVMTGYTEEIKSLESEIKKIKGEKTKFEAKSYELEQQNNKLNLNLSNLDEQISHISKIEDEKYDLEKKIEDLEKKIDDLTKELERVTNTKNEKITLIEAEKKEKDKIIIDLNAQIIELGTNINTLKMNNSDLKKIINDGVTVTSTLRDNYDKLNTQYNNILEKLRLNDSQLSVNNEKMETLIKEKNEIQKNLSNEIETYKTRIKSLESKEQLNNIESQRSIDSYKFQLNELDRQIVELNNKYNTDIESQKKLKSDIDKSKKLLKIIDKKLIDYISELYNNQDLLNKKINETEIKIKNNTKTDNDSLIKINKLKNEMYLNVNNKQINTSLINTCINLISDKSILPNYDKYDNDNNYDILNTYTISNLINENERLYNDSIENRNINYNIKLKVSEIDKLKKDLKDITSENEANKLKLDECNTLIKSLEGQIKTLLDSKEQIESNLKLKIDELNETIRLLTEEQKTLTLKNKTFEDERNQILNEYDKKLEIAFQKIKIDSSHLKSDIKNKSKLYGIKFDFLIVNIENIINNLTEWKPKIDGYNTKLKDLTKILIKNNKTKNDLIIEIKTNLEKNKLVLEKTQQNFEKLIKDTKDLPNQIKELKQLKQSNMQKINQLEEDIKEKNNKLNLYISENEQYRINKDGFMTEFGNFINKMITSLFSKDKDINGTVGEKFNTIFEIHSNYLNELKDKNKKLEDDLSKLQISKQSSDSEFSRQIKKYSLENKQLKEKIGLYETTIKKLELKIQTLEKSNSEIILALSNVQSNIDETLPSGDETLPPGDETLPPGDETLPPGDETSLSEKITKTPKELIENNLRNLDECRNELKKLKDETISKSEHENIIKILTETYDSKIKDMIKTNEICQTDIFNKNKIIEEITQARNEIIINLSKNEITISQYKTMEENLEKKNIELISKVNNLNEKIKEYIYKIRSKNNEIIHLKEKIKIYDDGISSMISKITKLNSTINFLREHINTKGSIIQFMFKFIDEKIIKLNEFNSKLNGLIITLHNKNSFNFNKYSSLKQLNDEYISNLDKLQKDITNIDSNNKEHIDEISKRYNELTEQYNKKIQEHEDDSKKLIALQETEIKEIKLKYENEIKKLTKQNKSEIDKLILERDSNLKNINDEKELFIKSNTKIYNDQIDILNKKINQLNQNLIVIKSKVFTKIEYLYTSLNDQNNTIINFNEKIKTNNNKIQEIHKKINTLKQNNIIKQESLNKQILDLINNKDIEKSKFDALNKQNKEYEDNIREIAFEYDVLQNQNIILNKRIVDYEKEDIIKKQIAAEIEQLHKELEEFRSVKNNEIKVLNDEKTNYLRDNKLMAEEIDILNKKIQDNNSKLKDYFNKIINKNKEKIEQTQYEINETKQILSTIEQENLGNITKLNELKKELEQVKQKNETTNIQLDDQIKKLTEEKNQLINDTTKQEKINSLSDEIQSLKDEQTKLNESNKTVVEQLNYNIKQINDLSKFKSSEIIRLKNKLALKNTIKLNRLKKLAEIITKLEKDLSSLKNKNDELLKIIDNLNIEINKLKNDSDKNIDEITNLSSELSLLNTTKQIELNQLNDEKNQYQKQLNKIKLQLQQLNQPNSIFTFNKENNNNLNNIEKLIEDYNKLKLTINSKDEEITKLLLLNTTKQVEIDSINNEKNQYQEQLNKIKLQLQQLNQPNSIFTFNKENDFDLNKQIKYEEGDLNNINKLIEDYNKLKLLINSKDDEIIKLTLELTTKQVENNSQIDSFNNEIKKLKNKIQEIEIANQNKKIELEKEYNKKVEYNNKTYNDKINKLNLELDNSFTQISDLKEELKNTIISMTKHHEIELKSINDKIILDKTKHDEEINKLNKQIQELERLKNEEKKNAETLENELKTNIELIEKSTISGNIINEENINKIKERLKHYVKLNIQLSITNNKLKDDIVYLKKENDILLEQYNKLISDNNSNLNELNIVKIKYNHNKLILDRIKKEIRNVQDKLSKEVENNKLSSELNKKLSEEIIQLEKDKKEFRIEIENIKNTIKNTEAMSKEEKDSLEYGLKVEINQLKLDKKELLNKIELLDKIGIDNKSEYAVVINDYDKTIQKMDEELIKLQFENNTLRSELEKYKNLNELNEDHIKFLKEKYQNIKKALIDRRIKHGNNKIIEINELNELLSKCNNELSKCNDELYNCKKSKTVESINKIINVIGGDEFIIIQQVIDPRIVIKQQYNKPKIENDPYSKYLIKNKIKLNESTIIKKEIDPYSKYLINNKIETKINNKVKEIDAYSKFLKNNIKL